MIVMIHNRDKKLTPPPPPPENERASHLNETALQNKNLWNGILESCEPSKVQSKVRRLLLKFLLLAPPAFLFKIKPQNPFQNLNVDLLMNEAYGHTFSYNHCSQPKNTFIWACTDFGTVWQGIGDTWAVGYHKAANSQSCYGGDSYFPTYGDCVHWPGLTHD